MANSFFFLTLTVNQSFFFIHVYKVRIVMWRYRNSVVKLSIKLIFVCKCKFSVIVASYVVSIIQLELFFFFLDSESTVVHISLLGRVFVLSYANNFSIGTVATIFKCSIFSEGISELFGKSGGNFSPIIVGVFPERLENNGRIAFFPCG